MPLSPCREIGPAMGQRILKVLTVGVAQQRESIVLGAWGCGEFGNDEHAMVTLFHKVLHEEFA
jgi:uncharacterized protein (TIGR02452 family)